MTQSLLNTSLRSVWRISWPLMIMYISTFSMMFVDRLFLSSYSIEALNAATTAGTFSWGFVVSASTLAALAEVFVAQRNGACKPLETAAPAWQMIWFSLFSFAFFIPLAFYFSPIFYPDSPVERSYFSAIIAFAPFYVFVSAASSFFIGRGNVKTVQRVAITANICNILLDPLFIFGVKGFIPEMGAKGAAIATGISFIVESLLIGYIFLSKHNATNYNTRDYSFDKNLFKDCIRLGSPSAIATGLEIGAWACFYSLMAKISKDHIYISSINQTFLLFFMFFGLSIEKGVAAIAGNIIGSKKQLKLSSLIRSGVYLSLSYGMFLLVVALIAIHLDAFSYIIPNSALHPQELRSSIEISIIMICFYLILECARWVYSGVLIAAGDTLFLLFTRSSSIWFFLVLPTYLYVYLPKNNVEVGVAFSLFYAVVILLITIMRYKSGAWSKTLSSFSHTTKKI